MVFGLRILSTLDKSLALNVSQVMSLLSWTKVDFGLPHFFRYSCICAKVKTESVYNITGSFGSAASTTSASVHQWIECYRDVLKGILFFFPGPRTRFLGGG